MDFNTLVAAKGTAGSIRNWINRDTTDPATVLTEAQGLIFTQLRHWKMKAESTGTMTASATAIGLPSDFLDNRGGLRLTGVYAARLCKNDEDAVQERWEYDNSGNRTTGTPTAYYLSGTTMVLDAAADQAYPYRLSYYQRPAALSTSTATNFLTNEYPRLLRTACMLIAVEFEKEVGQGQFDRTYWQQQFDKQLNEVQSASDIIDGDTESGPEFR